MLANLQAAPSTCLQSEELPLSSQAEHIFNVVPREGDRKAYQMLYSNKIK